MEMTRVSIFLVLIVSACIFHAGLARNVPAQTEKTETETKTENVLHAKAPSPAGAAELGDKKNFVYGGMGGFAGVGGIGGIGMIPAFGGIGKAAGIGGVAGIGGGLPGAGAIGAGIAHGIGGGIVHP